MVDYVVLDGWRSWLWQANQLPVRVRGYPRLTAITRMLFFRDVPIRLRCGRVVRGDLANSHWNRVAVRGFHEINTERFLVEYLRPGDIFVDVGAHVGLLTAVAATVVGPAGCVYSFEPDERVFCDLTRTITRNVFSNVRAEQLALGDVAGEAQFSRPQGSWGAFQVKGTEKGNEQWTAYLKVRFRTSKADVRTYSMTTLDEYTSKNNLGPITLVKIDVDGPELKVLRGMTGLLSSASPPALVVEVSSFSAAWGCSLKDTVEFLNRFDYKIFVNPMSRAEVNLGAENGPFVRIRRAEDFPYHDDPSFNVNLYCLKPTMYQDRCRSLWFVSAWELGVS